MSCARERVSLRVEVYHWTDSKIRVHSFYCLLGLSLLHYVLRQAEAFRLQLTVEKLQEELEQVQ